MTLSDHWSPRERQTAFGNDEPYRTAPKGLHVRATNTREHLQVYIRIEGGLKRRLVNTMPVPKRNIDHVNVVSRLSRIHATGIFHLAIPAY